MFWFALAHSVAFLLELAVGTRRGDREKGLQILVLRQQRRLLRRRRPTRPGARTARSSPAPS